MSIITLKQALNDLGNGNLVSFQQLINNTYENIKETKKVGVIGNDELSTEFEKRFKTEVDSNFDLTDKNTYVSLTQALSYVTQETYVNQNQSLLEAVDQHFNSNLNQTLKVENTTIQNEANLVEKKRGEFIESNQKNKILVFTPEQNEQLEQIAPYTNKINEARFNAFSAATTLKNKVLPEIRLKQQKEKLNRLPLSQQQQLEEELKQTCVDFLNDTLFELEKMGPANGFTLKYKGQDGVWHLPNKYESSALPAEVSMHLQYLGADLFKPEEHVSLCEQYNHASELLAILHKPHSSFADKMTGFHKKLHEIRKQSKLQPGSRFAQFFKNISHVLKRIFFPRSVLAKKLNKSSLFTTRSRAEIAFDTLEKVDRKHLQLSTSSAAAA